MSSFNPPARTLMGPGPADIHPRVLSALSRPIIGHLDPAFQQMMEELKTLLRNALQTGNDITYPVSAPGSAGMETCFANLMEPGDKVIICRNGVFGSRMQQNVERMGGTAIMVDDPWGRAIDPQKLRDALPDIHIDEVHVAMEACMKRMRLELDVAALLNKDSGNTDYHTTVTDHPID